VSKAAPLKTEQRQWKLLLWTAVIGLVFGLIGFGEIAEDVLRASRNSFHRHPASGDIVFIKIDDKSLRSVGNWPWPRRTDGKLIDKLDAAGASKIAIDFNLSFPTNTVDDQALADSIRRSGRQELEGRAIVLF